MGDNTVQGRPLGHWRASVATRRKMKPKLRALALALAICALLLALFAGAAFAGYYGNVWLNWVQTGSQGFQYGAYTHLKQVGAEPRYESWGCGNMWKETHWIFVDWYCGSPGYSANTPELGGQGNWAQPVVWNDSKQDQDMWGWKYYYA